MGFSEFDRIRSKNRAYNLPEVEIPILESPRGINNEGKDVRVPDGDSIDNTVGGDSSDSGSSDPADAVSSSVAKDYKPWNIWEF